MSSFFFTSRCFIISLFALMATTSGQARDLPEILDSGQLVIGIRERPSLYSPTTPELPGFAYEIVNAFAKNLGVSLRIVTISKFKDYWMHGDTFLLREKNITRTPDIYQSIDLAAEIFTVTDRRRKLIHMVPYIDNVEIFYGHEEINSNSYETLRGKSIFLFESMSFYTIVSKRLKGLAIPFSISKIHIQAGEVITDSTDGASEAQDVHLMVLPKDQELFGLGSYMLVVGKELDVGITDSMLLLRTLHQETMLRNKLKPLFPARDTASQLAFGCAHGTPLLNTRLDTFMKDFTTSTEFSQLLMKYTGYTTVEYKALIVSGTVR